MHFAELVGDAVAAAGCGELTSLDLLSSYGGRLIGQDLPNYIWPPATGDMAPRIGRHEE